jgi:hypothetical protein
VRGCSGPCGVSTLPSPQLPTPKPSVLLLLTLVPTNGGTLALCSLQNVRSCSRAPGKGLVVARFTNVTVTRCSSHGTRASVTANQPLRFLRWRKTTAIWNVGLAVFASGLVGMSPLVSSHASRPEPRPRPRPQPRPRPRPLGSDPYRT